MKNTIRMEWSKETKGTHVYANSEPDTAVPTLYIKKSGLPPKAPSILTLTIEYDEDNSSA